MNRWYSQKEIGDRMDCMGQFDSEDEICLRRCGLNIQCASMADKDFHIELLDEMSLDFPQ